MDPELMLLLAPVPVLGIALIVAAIWALGGRAPGRIADAAGARRAAAEGLFGFVGGEVVLAVDGAGALVHAEHGEGIAVLSPLGDRFVARLLAPGDVASLAHRGDGDVVELTIRTADFTMRNMRLRFAPADAAQAERWLAPLRAAEPATAS